MPDRTYRDEFKLEKTIKFLRVQWVDYTGTLRLRILPISAVEATFEYNYFGLKITAAALGLLQDDHPTPDMSATGMYGLDPDFSSKYVLSHSDLAIPQHAMVMCDLTLDDEGTGAPLCPRSNLKKVVQKATLDHNLEILMGFETEVVFIPRNDQGELRVGTPHAHAWSLASALLPARLRLLEEISDNLEAAGINVEMMHAESADGQFEVITGPLSPVAAVDQLYATRQIISTTAMRHGFHATLHPAPFKMQPGTSSHMHFSVDNERDDERDEMIQDLFAAGVLAHLKALTPLGMSSLASYGRMNDNMWAAGTWVCWGPENREVPLRKITGHNSHWELRCIDGTANAYVMAAATIHAGLLGIKNEAILPEIGCTANPASLTEKERAAIGITERMPSTLMDGIKCLQADTELVAAIGKDVVEKFAIVKTAEAVKVESIPEGERWLWEIEHY